MNGVKGMTSIRLKWFTNSTSPTDSTRSQGTGTGAAFAETVGANCGEGVAVGEGTRPKLVWFQGVSSTVAQWL